MTEYVFETLGVYALTWSWQLLLLGAAVWLVLQIDRRHRPEFRSRVLTWAMVAALLLPWLPSRLSQLPWTASLREVVVPEPLERLESLAPLTPLKRVLSSSPRTPTPAEQQGPTSVTARDVVLSAVGKIWILGVAIAALRRVLAHIRLLRIVAGSFAPPGDWETAVRSGREPGLRLSHALVSPMLCGRWRPLILMPADVAQWASAEERDAMLQHERAHAERKDQWARLVEEVFLTLLFFHPVARWFGRKANTERELACDALALRGDSSPDVYAETLLKAAANAARSGARFAGVAFAQSASAAQLQHRIEMLFRVPPPSSKLRFATIAVAAIVGPIVGLSVLQAQAVLPTSVLVPPLAPTSATAPPVAQEPTLQRTAARRISPVLAMAGLEVAPLRPQNPPNSAGATTGGAVLEEGALDVQAFVLRGNGLQDEVRVVVSVPYRKMTWSEGPFVSRRSKGSFEVEVTNLAGRIVGQVDDPIEVMAPAESSKTLPDSAAALYTTGFLLGPGLYRLQVRFTDALSGSVDTVTRRLEAPRLAGISWSSLILADLLEDTDLPSAFTIGSRRIRPSMQRTFRSDQTLHAYLEAYGQAANSPTSVETTIRRGDLEVYRTSELVNGAEKIVITRSIPLTGFLSGDYSIRIRVLGGPAQHDVSSSFRVE